MKPLLTGAGYAVLVRGRLEKEWAGFKKKDGMTFKNLFYIGSDMERGNSCDS